MEHDHRIAPAIAFRIDKISEQIFEQVHSIKERQIDGTTEQLPEIALCEKGVARFLENLKGGFFSDHIVRDQELRINGNAVAFGKAKRSAFTSADFKVVAWLKVLMHGSENIIVMRAFERQITGAAIFRDDFNRLIHCVYLRQRHQFLSV